MAKIVAIKMDRERHLKYGTNALIELEKITNKPITEIGAEVSMADLRAMFYVGLKWEDKNLTLEETGDLLDIALEHDSFEGLAEKLSQALTGALNNTALPSEK